MPSRMSPGRKNSAAGDAATVVVTASTSRRSGLWASYFCTQCLGQHHLARGRERHLLPLDLDRAQLLGGAQVLDHVDDEVRLDAHVDLREVAAGLVGEARPHAEHSALRVDDRAVEVRRPVHERRDLEIRVAEAQRARLRERRGGHVRDVARLAQLLEVRTEPDDRDVLARVRAASCRTSPT